MEIRTVRAQLFRVDRRTGGHLDLTRLIDAFRKFAKALKKGLNPVCVSSCVLCLIGREKLLFLCLCHTCVMLFFDSYNNTFLSYSFNSSFSSDVIYHIPHQRFYVISV